MSVALAEKTEGVCGMQMKACGTKRRGEAQSCEVAPFSVGRCGVCFVSNLASRGQRSPVAAAVAEQEKWCVGKDWSWGWQSVAMRDEHQKSVLGMYCTV